MSAQNPITLTEWLQNLPVPWLFGNPVGKLDAASQGAVLDQQVALVKLATKAHMPDYAPTDALSRIGGDRELEKGPNETNANFITRLKTAWDDWARAGTAVELLTQLYWAGFPGAVLVQQNGLAYSLSGVPTAGVDPTPLLRTSQLGGNAALGALPAAAITVSIVSGGVLGVMTYSVSMSGIVSGTTLSSATAPFYQIPGTPTVVNFAANTYVTGSIYTIDTAGLVTGFSGAVFPGATQVTRPCWTFDGYDAHTSRFAVLFPTSGGAFTTVGTATFTGVEDGSVANPWPVATWNNAFPDTVYLTQAGPPTITDGSGGIIVTVDGTTKTTTGVQVTASAPFAGTVNVLAWQPGTNPYANIHPADLSRLARIINRWRPAKALCMGVWAVARSPVWGYPITTTWGQAGLAWGQSSSVQFGV